MDRPKTFNKKGVEKGGALLISLLMLSMIAVISLEILAHTRAEIKQATSMDVYDRIYMDLQGFQYWAIQALRAYKENEMIQPAQFKPESFEWHARITGEWQDQLALFNLNALKNADLIVIKGFMNLLVRVGKIEEKEAYRIAQAIELYLKKVERINSVSEFRMMEGVTQPLYNKIQPYLTALPNSMHKININSVKQEDPAVLLTLSGKMTLEQAKAILSCRSGFINAAEINNFVNCIRQKNIPIAAEFVYFSAYFLAIGSVKIGLQQHTLYTFLEKNVALNKPPTVRLWWQTYDTK